MSVKVAYLNPRQLDWAVATCKGVDERCFRLSYEPMESRDLDRHNFPEFHYSTVWSQGGPTIESELIMIGPKWNNAGYESATGFWTWRAYVLGPDNQDDPFEQEGPTPLIAAMRCYVASKMGDEVELPSYLQG